jgi:hypothetical protein
MQQSAPCWPNKVTNGPKSVVAISFSELAGLQPVNGTIHSDRDAETTCTPT